MILRDELTRIGRINKTHGIGGDLSATFDIDVDDLNETVDSLRCIVVEFDGIFVPFFIRLSRPRSASTLLISLDGVDSETAAAKFVGKDIYALSAELPDEEADDEGLYASDLIGYTILSDGANVIATITGIDDSTANVLFIAERPGSSAPIYIPVADEFITEISTTDKTITMALPQGLIDLN